MTEKKTEETIKPIKPSRHKTTKLVLVEEDIDLLMVPVVKWINSFPFTESKYCCEGTSFDELKQVPPYIMFYCTNEMSLIRILHWFGLSSSVIVEVSFYHGHLRYVARFKNKRTLKSFIKELERD